MYQYPNKMIIKIFKENNHLITIIVHLIKKYQWILKLVSESLITKGVFKYSPQICLRNVWYLQKEKRNTERNLADITLIK